MRVATRQDAAVKPVSTSRSGRGTKYLHRALFIASGYGAPSLYKTAKSDRMHPKGLHGSSNAFKLLTPLLCGTLIASVN